jgi:hypothetical protein
MPFAAIVRETMHIHKKSALDQAVLWLEEIKLKEAQYILLMLQNWPIIFSLANKSLMQSRLNNKLSYGISQIISKLMWCITFKSQIPIPAGYRLYRYLFLS